MKKEKLAKLIPSEPHESAKQWALDILITMVGMMIYSAAVKMFTAPNQIAPGGLTGISTIINYLTQGVVDGGLPIGTVNLVLNIPIAILGFWKLGRHFMTKTIVALLSFTLFSDYVFAFVPVATDNKLLAGIFGGALMGAGIGLMLSRGGSSGGFDIINKIIQRRLPHIKLGQVVFASDLVIVTLSMFAYRSVEPGLYALIALFISSQALDKVLYGFNTCKFMYIVTDKAQELGHRINTEMRRGATILESYGSYTNEKRPTVMVAVRQNEYYRMKKIIDATDPDAFIIVTSASEIVGKGFTKAGPYGMPKKF